MCDSLQPHIPARVLLSMEFSRQEYWSGLPFPFPEDLSDPGIELTSPEAPALQGDFSALEPPGKPTFILTSDLLTVPISLPLPECRVIGIIQNVTFSDWHISV